MKSFEYIQQHVLSTLESRLSKSLTYHNIPHTLDVVQQALVIAENEGIVDEHKSKLLKIGALYHDVGFIDVYNGHEERSCQIASNDLNAFGFSQNDIRQVLGMIAATKVPQQPQTLLEQIIRDADLDYLGRADFFKIGDELYKEFKSQQIVSNYKDWDELQVRFLENHQYCTNSSKRRRQAQKQAHLLEVKRRLTTLA